MSEKDDNMQALLGLDVKPLKQDRIAPYRKALDPTPRQRLLNEDRALQELLELSDESINYETGDEVRFLRDGHPPRLLKKLRRGDYAIQDQLDLHGLVTTEAKEHTHGFINECARDDVRAVRIVHGKGHHSSGRVPIIKNLLIGWLSKNPHVIGAISTPVRDGGTGAVYVLLNKTKT